MGLHIYGFRVAKPQHDGTPHWHLLLFMPKENVKQVGNIIRDYAIREDGDEPGAAKHRYTEKRIDRSKGTAARAQPNGKSVGQHLGHTPVSADWRAACKRMGKLRRLMGWEGKELQKHWKAADKSDWKRFVM